VAYLHRLRICSGSVFALVAYLLRSRICTGSVFAPVRICTGTCSHRTANLEIICLKVRS